MPFNALSSIVNMIKDSPYLKPGLLTLEYDSDHFIKYPNHHEVISIIDDLYNTIYDTSFVDFTSLNFA